MPDSLADIGYGSLVEISDSADSPTAFVELGEITNITPPSAEVDQIDVTHMQSPDRRREFIPGLTDGREFSFEMNYVPGSAGDLELLEILSLGVGVDRRRQCRITYPNNERDTFTGSLQTYQPTIPVDDKMTANVAFKVSGAIARDTAS